MPRGVKTSFLLRAVKSLSIDHLLDRNIPQTQPQSDTSCENQFYSFEDSIDDLYDESVSDDFHCYVLPEPRTDELLDFECPNGGSLDPCDRPYDMPEWSD